MGGWRRCEKTSFPYSVTPVEPTYAQGDARSDLGDYPHCVNKAFVLVALMLTCLGICLAPFGITVSDTEGLCDNSTALGLGCVKSSPLVVVPMQAYADTATSESSRTVHEAPFAASQSYDGTLYVGDVRTNEGDRTVTSIPNSATPPVSAERFLFSDGYYYYVENFPGNGSSAVKLRRYDLSSKDDVVLSDDVFSGTDVFFADGKIAFQSFKDDSVVTVVDAKTGRTQDIDFGDQKGLKQLVGFHEGNAYFSVSLYGSPTVVYHRAMTDSEPYTVTQLDADEAVVGLFEGALVTVNDRHVEASDEGGFRWSCDLDQRPAVGRFLYSDGYLFFDTSTKVDETPKCVGRISLKDGSVEQHMTGLPYILKVIHADKIGIYFCAMEDSSMETIMGSSFATYCCSIATGIISNMDELHSDGARSTSTRAMPSKSSYGNADARDGYRVFHVRTKDFEFDLPSYWRGKVEWFEERLSNGYVRVTICPIGMAGSTLEDHSRYALVTVSSTDADARREGGDIGGGLIEHVDSSTKDVVVYQKNWIFIGRENGPGSQSGSYKFTQKELDKLVGLSTGGKLDSSDCKYTSNDTVCMSYNKSQFVGNVKVGFFDDPPTPTKSANEYAMPDSDLVTYNYRIWNDMSNHELFIARNELFARYGCGFKSQELRDYFGKQYWYKETIDAGTYDTDILNSDEKQNAEFMLSIERERNSPYI